MGVQACLSWRLFRRELLDTPWGGYRDCSYLTYWVFGLTAGNRVVQRVYARKE